MIEDFVTERYTDMRSFSARLGAAEVQIHAPEFSSTGWQDSFTATMPSGQLYGLDVESTALTDLGQWDPDFKIRLVQFATESYAWVLDLDDGQQLAAACGFLANPHNTFVSHTPMDVLAIRTVLGMDIAERNLDTRMLAAMAAPDDRLGNNDLKSLADRHLGPELSEAETRLHTLFRQLWVDNGGKRNAAARLVDTAGWNAVSPNAPEYLIYAGLDAVACRRLAPILTAAASAPGSLLRAEQWLAVQATRIQARGMRVDVEALRALSDEATRATTAARTAVQELTGLSPLSPKLPAWLEEHAVVFPPDHPRTDKGHLQMTADAVRDLRGWMRPSTPTPDPQALAVLDHVIDFKSHQDALTKTQGITRGVGVDGRIHPQLNTLGAVTGRMSSSGPNFQNMSKSNPRMRGLFLPEPGHVLVTCDFDQVELRVVAALAREQKMIDVILAGGDLHQLTVDELAEAGFTITRAVAKIVNFLIVYGGGGGALAAQAKLPLELASAVVRAHRERYPAIAELTWQLAEHRDAIRTISGRRIPVGRTKTGDLRTYANINYLVQSSARDLLVGAWCTFADLGHADKVWFPVHDELVLQVPEDEVEQTLADIERSMNFDFLGVPITATAVVLRDEHGISRWMTGSLAESIAGRRNG